MTDFVDRALHPDQNDWIIESLLDVDFYKPNMDFYEAEYLPDVIVTYGLINRSCHVPLGLMVDEGEAIRQLDHAMGLVMGSTGAAFLSGMDAYGVRLYPERQIKRFKELRLCSYSLRREGDQYHFRVSGPNKSAVSWWETIAMCIFIELKTRAILKYMTRNELRTLYARATDKVASKYRLLKKYPGIGIVNFGTRRRHSRLWERYITEIGIDELKSQFRGISNVKLAMDLDATPSGTNAHQEPTQHVALAYPDPEAMRQAPYTFLRNWEKLFPSALCIELPDAYTTEAFYRYMPEDLAIKTMRLWRGTRHDSGEATEECRKYITRCHTYGVDPMTKLYIFSDGLTHTQIVELYEEFGQHIQLSFGWGTNLTNDFQGCHPDFDQPFTHISGINLSWDQVLAGMSLVCKVVEVDGVPAVKISNNPNKATGVAEYVDYYKKVFGVGAQVAQDVLV
ncbi:MAG: nicotinate phosphoribosyltransferase [bacterium]|nr:nicotinate phosphoribosyltransferase [bacterium]